MGEQYTEAELAGLSEEEREAILSGTEEEREALNAVVSDDDEDGGEGEQGDGEGDGEEQDNEGGESAEAEPEGDDRSAFVPRYEAAPVEDYDTKLSDLDAKFEAGDIELKDYNRQRDELVRMQLKAEIAAEQNEQIEKQLWQREIDDFMEAHPEYNTSKFRHAALDIAVKDLANKEENSDKPGRWFLREAHKIVQAEFGQTGAKPADGEKKPDGDKKPAPRKPNTDDVPPNLSKIPPADNAEAAGEFDYLDKLTGIEHERALARLSPEARDRYFAS